MNNIENMREGDHFHATWMFDYDMCDCLTGRIVITKIHEDSSYEFYDYETQNKWCSWKQRNIELTKHEPRKLKLTSDFLWNVITPKESRKIFGLGFIDVFILYDDDNVDSESLIETKEELEQAIEHGREIGLVIGKREELLPNYNYER